MSDWMVWLIAPAWLVAAFLLYWIAIWWRNASNEWMRDATRPISKHPYAHCLEDVTDAPHFRVGHIKTRRGRIFVRSLLIIFMPIIASVCIVVYILQTVAAILIGVTYGLAWCIRKGWEVFTS